MDQLIFFMAFFVSSNILLSCNKVPQDLFLIYYFMCAAVFLSVIDGAAAVCVFILVPSIIFDSVFS